MCIRDRIQTVSGVGLANLTKAGDLTTNGTTAGTIGGDIETLNNYVAGTTTIYLPGINGTNPVASTSVENNIASAVGAVAAGNLLAAVSAAAKQVAAKSVAWFSYGGNEYVYPVSYTHLHGAAGGKFGQAGAYPERQSAHGRVLGGPLRVTELCPCLLYTSRCV